MSQVPFKTSTFVDDLDLHTIGLVAFKSDCKHLPVAGQYGVCLALNMSTSWVWQFAVMTETGGMYVRRRINAKPWSNWVQL